MHHFLWILLKHHKNISRAVCLCPYVTRKVNNVCWMQIYLETILSKSTNAMPRFYHYGTQPEITALTFNKHGTKLSADPTTPASCNKTSLIEKSSRSCNSSFMVWRRWCGLVKHHQLRACAYALLQISSGSLIARSRLEHFHGYFSVETSQF